MKGLAALAIFSCCFSFAYGQSEHVRKFSILNSCYLMSPSRVFRSSYEAASFCAFFRYRPVAINGFLEDQGLVSYLRTSDNTANPYSISGFWTSGAAHYNASQNSYNFVWESDNSTVSYTNWNEPVGTTDISSSPSVIRLSKRHGYRWVASGAYIGTGAHALCEKQGCGVPCQHGGVCSCSDTCLCPPQYTGEFCEKGPDCSQTCPPGKVLVEPVCDGCVCPNRVAVGAVQDLSGFPLANVTIRDANATSRELATTNSEGEFIFPNGCSGDFLELSKQHYITTVVQYQGVRAVFRMGRIIRPFITLNPTARSVEYSQTFSLCCRAFGDPAPRYEWYKDGAWVNKPYDNTAGNLTIYFPSEKDSGNYVCKAVSEAGSVLSPPVAVEVRGFNFGNPDNLCRSAYTVANVSICSPTDVVALGRCEPISCQGRGEATRCGKDGIFSSCSPDPTSVQLFDHPCTGFRLALTNITNCICQRIPQNPKFVVGRAAGFADGLPLRNGNILLNGNLTGRTDDDGDFNITIPPGITRPTLTFEDTIYKRYLDFTTMVQIQPTDTVYTLTVPLLDRSAPKRISSSRNNFISVSAGGDSVPIVQLEISADSFYTASGRLYNGDVYVSANLLDPGNIEATSATPNNLNYIDESGQTRPLISYGVFSVIFQAEDGQELTVQNLVNVYVDSRYVTMSDNPSLPGPSVWSLNLNTGYWEHLENLKVDALDRRKREAQTFLVGSMELTAGWLSVGFPQMEVCELKVRVYKNLRDALQNDPYGQVAGINVRVLLNYTQDNGHVMLWYTTARTEGRQGVCIPVPCDMATDDLFAYITAKLDGLPLHAVETSLPYATLLDDKRTIKTAIFDSAGNREAPIYTKDAGFSLSRCGVADAREKHFQFYIESANVGYQFTAVSQPLLFSPFSINSLAWYYRRNSEVGYAYQACFIKVSYDYYPRNTRLVRARSVGGTHTAIRGKLLGIREVILDTRMGCLEYKCSGSLASQNYWDTDLTRVYISSDGSNCSLSFLASGLAHRNLTNSPFQISAPPLHRANETEYTGFYHAFSVSGVEAAREAARRKCFAGSMRVQSSWIIDNGEAVGFRCSMTPPPLP